MQPTIPSSCTESTRKGLQKCASICVSLAIWSPDIDDRTLSHFSPTETDIGNGIHFHDQFLNTEENSTTDFSAAIWHSQSAKQSSKVISLKQKLRDHLPDSPLKTSAPPPAPQSNLRSRTGHQGTNQGRLAGHNKFSLLPLDAEN